MMHKKIKQNATNIKDGSNNIDQRHTFKKKKQKIQNDIKYNPVIVKDQISKFKNKHKKNTHELRKKIKSIQNNEENPACTNFINSDTVKIVDLKNGAQIRKLKFSVKNEKKQQKLNENEQGKQKKHCANQIFNQSNETKNISKKSIKETNSPCLSNSNKSQIFKSTKHKKKKKQKGEDKMTKWNSVLQKTKEQVQDLMFPLENSNIQAITKNTLDIKKLEEMLVAKQKQEKKEKENAKPQSLRERMMAKLKTSRFRYLNETLYNSESFESKKYFKDDPDAFKAYHEGYKQQIQQWPLNPLDVIISSLKTMPNEYIIADFGCGEAKLAVSVTQKVHSFDFVSLNDNVTVCDMAHTPLLTNGVHVVVFCLSLMGTNLKDYIIEANRVLKKDGVLKIAEVESRFGQIGSFIETLNEYGFKNTWKDLSHNLFYFLDFKKERNIDSKKNKLSPINLKPCLYKKR